MVEDLAARRRMDRRDQTKFAAALARHDVCLEYALDQLRPGVIFPPAFSILANAVCRPRRWEFGRLVGICAIPSGRIDGLRGLCRRNDLRSPLRRWTKDPRVAPSEPVGSARGLRVSRSVPEV